MRLSAASLDIDAFRSFIEAAGGAFDAARPEAGEVLRFRIGHSFGVVSRRKDGRLTLAGEAKTTYRQFNTGRRSAKPPMIEVEKEAPRPARILTITLKADEHLRARELLADAKSATVFTDGSATSGGKGRGGWAAIIRAGFTNVEIYGGALASTVNRMEIIAAIVALEVLPPGCVVKINTDSQYLRKGITTWIDGWKRYGWRTVAREPVKNADLWRRLDIARGLHDVRWKWVPAHRGIKANERADELAKRGRHEFKEAEGK